ncbi:MAG: hypothetical protein ACT4PK_06975 [Gammaproteobacteria bacterium]
MIRSTLLAAALASCAGACAAETPAPAAPAAESPGNCAAIGDPTLRLACYDKHFPPTLSGATPVAAPDDKTNRFGMPTPEHDRPPDSIKTRIVGTVVSWKRGTQFRLENGQVWRATGDDTGHYTTIPDNPEVSISKSAFGAYWLDIVAVGARIKVKRVS